MKRDGNNVKQRDLATGTRRSVFGVKMGMLNRMGRSFGILLALLALVLTAGVGVVRLHPNRAVAAQAIDAGDYYFAPASISISVGETVTWTSSGGEGHTVTASDNSWGTDDLEPGDSFSHTFTSAETYSYACTIHDGMTGTITVR
jgi:plastocyanin